MKILVVGGAGYLGGAVTDILQKTKHEMRVYDSLLYEESYLKKIDFINADVRDRKKLLPQLKWADAVIWLAALVGDGACALNPEITFDINTNAVATLTRNYDRRIIFTSTCSVYGAQSAELNEDSPVNPLSAYAASKLKAEKFLLKKNAIIFRLGTLFGLGDSYSRIRMDLVINVLTARAYKTGSLTVFGGNQYRPVLHVKDTAELIVRSLTSKPTGIFNLRNENIKIVDLARRVKKFFPKLKIETVSREFEDTRNYRVNMDKAQKKLLFKPKYSIEYGIAELKKLLEEKRIVDIENPRYTNQKYLSIFKTHEH